jgi:hypothetical protein
VARALPFSRSRRPNCKVGRYEAPPLPATLDRRRPYGIVDRMEYGRLVKVMPPHGARNVEPVVYVVAAEDPNEAMKLVADKVVIGSDMEVVGRASHQLLDALNLKPGEIARA